MNNAFASPFSQATKEVFKMMLDLDVTDTNALLQGILLGKRVNVFIDVTGDLNGTVLYTFPENMTFEMVKIMCGMEMSEVDEFVTSALGEMANIISGNAMTALSEQNLKCDITPPRITIDGVADPNLEKQVIRIPLHSDIGDLAIDVSFKGAVS